MQHGQTSGNIAGHAPAILLVEDNPAMRALVRSLVAEVASVVHESASGEEALDCYARVRPDWVLMDIKLGGIDGLAATRALRQLDPEARILIVTECNDDQYRRAAEAAGARGFVLKDNLLTLPTLLTRGETP